MKRYVLTLFSIFLLSATSLVAQQPKDQYERIDGVLHVTRYYDDGTVREKGAFNEDGAPDGQWLLYSRDGKLLTEALYVDGKKEGKWFVWTEDGTFLYEVVYEDNYLVNSNRWKIQQRDLIAVD